jgi:hypothetical protein
LVSYFFSGEEEDEGKSSGCKIKKIFGERGKKKIHKPYQFTIAQITKISDSKRARITREVLVKHARRRETLDWNRFFKIFEKAFVLALIVCIVKIFLEKMSSLFETVSFGSDTFFEVVVRTLEFLANKL